MLSAFVNATLKLVTGGVVIHLHRENIAWGEIHWLVTRATKTRHLT